MEWYDGPSLLHHLEHIHVASDRDLVDTRFPVQYVVRPKSDDYHDYRGYAGRVAGGVFKPGDEVLVLPSGLNSTIQGIDLFDEDVDEAFPPMSVTVRLDDDLDVSRGDMICRPQNASAAEPGHRRDGVLDVADTVAAAAEAARSSTRPAPRARWSRTSSTGSTSTRCTATRRQGTRAQRDRPRPAPQTVPMFRRSVRQEPHDRFVRADRRGHRSHGGRRHDQHGQLTTSVTWTRAGG